MPFDAIRCLVETKPFGLHTRITGVLHRLRINDDRRCPFGFFSPVRVLVHVRRSSASQSRQPRATVYSASKLWSKAASLPSCSHFSVDKRCHRSGLVLSSLRVSFASWAVISQSIAVQALPIPSQLSYWSMASSLH